MILDRILMALVAGASAMAQVSPGGVPVMPGSTEPSNAQPVAPTPAPAPALVIAKGTLVEIQIDENLSSETSTPGQRFKLHSHRPVDATATFGIAAGATGEGEVVHAARKGAMGRSGELTVNARFLTCGSVRIPLGRLKIVAGFADRSAEALAVSMAVPLGGLLIKGGAIDLPAGTIGQARVMADVALPLGSTNCSDAISTKETL